MGSRVKAPVAVLAALSALWVAAAAPGVAAQEEASVSPLVELQRAANTERGEKRRALVEAIRQASPDVAARLRQDLIAEVEGALQADDTAFVVHCILALGELAAQEGTDALLAALGHPNGAIGYVAAEALGDIWAGRGSSDPAAERVTAALLVEAYKQGSSPALYGPAVALARINSLAETREVESAGPEELLATLDGWLAAGGGALPPLPQQ